MTTDRDLHDILDARLRDVPRLRATLLGDVFARTRTIPQHRHRWPLHVFERHTERLAEGSAGDVVHTAIPVTDGRTRPRGSAMLSAFNVMVAVIVALFGGFLLTDILATRQGDEVVPAAVTESPSPKTNDDILPGVRLTVQEVEPGVMRVVNDGIQDLTSVEAADIVAGYDGGVWLLRADVFLRLGSDDPHEWPMNSGPETHIFEVAPDGTMWVIPRGWGMHPFSDAREEAGLRSTGEEWTLQSCPGGWCYGLTVAPDGMLWATYRDEHGKWIGRLGPTGWEPLHEPGSVEADRLFPTEAGVLYGVEYTIGPKLFRYQGGAWERLCMGCQYTFDAGPDGSLWATGGSHDGISHLKRFAAGEWEEWISTDLRPDIAFNLGLDDQFRVAPDGSLWSSLWASADGEPPLNDDWSGAVCDGLVRFDRQTLDRFLPGHCVSLDIAPDGSVWVLGTEEAVWTPVWGDGRILADDDAWHLYVITPKAVAGSQ